MKTIFALMLLTVSSAFSSEIDKAFELIKSRVPELRPVSYKAIVIIEAGGHVETNQKTYTQFSLQWVNYPEKRSILCHAEVPDQRQIYRTDYHLLKNSVLAIDGVLYVCH